MKIKKILFLVILFMIIIYTKNTYALSLGVSNEEEFQGVTYTDEEIEIITHGGAKSPIVVEYGNFWGDEDITKINVQIFLATGMNITSAKTFPNEGTHAISGSNGNYDITFGNSSPDGEAVFEIKLPTPAKTTEQTLTATAMSYNNNQVVDTKTITVKYYILVKDKSCDSSTDASITATAGKPVKIGNFLGENYAFTTTEEKTDITVSTKSSKATVYFVVDQPEEIQGGKKSNIKLSMGDNNYGFIIKSECSKQWETIEDMISGAYIINTNLSDYSYSSSLITLSITREEKKEDSKDSKSSVNTLKNITISDAKITYKADVNQYTLSVPYEKESVTIKSTLTDSKSSYVEGYGNRTVKLNVGENEVLIKVKAENGNENTYTFKITREKNDDGTLKVLKVNNKEVVLLKNVYSYTSYVENKTTKAEIKAEANDKEAKIEITELKELIEGSNKVKVTITAASGKKIVYDLNIVRDKVVSVNSKLKTLKVENYSFDFSGDKTDYTLHVEKRTKVLDITATPENENATVEIEGNKKLKNGSVIKVRVTAQDKKTITTYTITIDKQDSNFFLIVLIIILVIAGVAGYFFYKNYKKN